jgi:hypothetical protein
MPIQPAIASAVVRTKLAFLIDTLTGTLIVPLTRKKPPRLFAPAAPF